MTNWTHLDIHAGGAAAGAAIVLFIEAGTGLVLGAEAHQPRARKAAQLAGFDGSQGGWLDLIGDGADLPRLLLLGLKTTAVDAAERWTAAGGLLFEAMRGLRLASAGLPAQRELPGADDLAALLTGALLHSFKLDQGRRETASGFVPQALHVDDGDAACAETARRLARPINRARAWVEQPANLLTPPVFADEAAAALREQGLTVRVLSLAELEELGAGALLAVARASEHEPRLLVAEWRGDASRAGWDAALVGKGLTFDGGGLNLKTRPVIEKMKLDMGGAAAVLGAIELAASRGSKLNVVAVVPMAENVIDGRGYRPGDVLRSMSGLTIEVLNTDAEGRLVLADGITYAIRHYAPLRIVDVATLTGMITAVLHEEFAGLYASDEALAQGLLAAGDRTAEPLWRLPLSARQDYIVESAVADVANLGAGGFLGVGHGSPAAGAKFLEKFARGTPWAHLDIAGTAWASRPTSRSGKGATGFGVALLDRWLQDLE